MLKFLSLLFFVALFSTAVVATTSQDNYGVAIGGVCENHCAEARESCAHNCNMIAEGAVKDDCMNNCWSLQTTCIDKCKQHEDK